MRKRAPSPDSSQNYHKRIRSTITTEPIIIQDSDDDDDELRDILAQIKQQEESEKLAKQLQEEWTSGGSSRNAIVVEDDDDEAFARQLAEEWEELAEVKDGSGSREREEPIVESREKRQYKHSAEGRIPTETMAFYRSIFTMERPCTKCGESVISPRGYVMLSGENISPSLGSLLHAPCSSCKTNHCRGCFKPLCCAVSCKGKAKNAGCTVDSCCAIVRAIAIFEALGGFDRQYIGEKATSHSRVANMPKNKSISGDGIGYGSDSYHGQGRGRGRGRGRGPYSEAEREVYRETARSKELAAHWEMLVIRALRMVSNLLPSPYAESAQEYDMLPHPSIGPLLSLSKIPDLLGDLLRNDSVTDWISRSDVYYAMLALLKRMTDCELTVHVLLESRFIMNSSPGIEPWMWDEGDIEWEKNAAGGLDRAPPLYDYFRKLSTQSQAFMAGIMASEDDSEETIKATALCGDIIATRDDVERAISVLGITSDPATASLESKSHNSKGKGQDISIALEKTYSQACERLAFKYVSLNVPESTGKGKGKASGLHYPSFNYAKDLSMTQNATRNPKDRLHLVKELAVLATSLPPGIWMRVDEVRNDVIKILIAGPEGTPYAGGLFEFDCFMPLAYPAVPPLMHLRTTGGGAVRFNPNLYNNGKVCLSLLGTWPGRPEEQWSPYKSTLLQVLVSIQSMILIDLPYFNEPGYGKANPNSAASINYNRNIALQTTRFAIVDWLCDEHRDGIWGEVIASHFSIRKEKIRKQIQDWAATDPQMRAYSSALGSFGHGGLYIPPLKMLLPLDSDPQSNFGGVYAQTPQHAVPSAMDLIKEFDERMLAVQKWDCAVDEA